MYIHLYFNKLLLTNCIFVEVCLIFIRFSLNELVRHNENGLVFSNENQLAMHIMTWFKNYPSQVCEKKNKFCKEIDSFRTVDWHTNWMNNAYSLFSND